MDAAKTLTRRIGPMTAIVCGLAVGTAHAATDVVWTFSNSGSPSSTFSYLGTDGTTKATATGWSNRRTCDNSGTCGTTSTTAANNEFGSEAMASFSGGIAVQRSSESSPEHATDNNGLTEFVLLSFDSAVSLKSLQINWPTSTYDTDMTVLAYNGQNIAVGANGEVLDGFGDAALGTEFQWLNSDTSDTAGTVGLTNGGWKLISNLYNVDDHTMVNINNNTNVVSSYWIIGAYNSHLTSGGDSTKDYNKLFAVMGDIPTGHHGTPEPATLGLFGLGLVGLRFARTFRRR